MEIINITSKLGNGLMSRMGKLNIREYNRDVISFINDVFYSVFYEDNFDSFIEMRNMLKTKK